jgi:NAD(P)-dependent dehydrogenase (short-subunit alcohol dehydrogenase family)
MEDAETEEAGMDGPVALVTGAGRGIGLEVCRQLSKKGHRVILTARDAARGLAALEVLERDEAVADFHVLDVTDPSSAAKTRDDVMRAYGRLDVLINNAGVLLEDWGDSALTTPLDTFHKTLDANFFGALHMCQAFVPVMKKQGHGRVVNVSSEAGQLEGMAAGAAAYRVSKTALNALTRNLGLEMEGTDVLVNAACPGWVRTDMGGAAAPRTPQQGADGIVWLATLPKGGPQGGFFQDKKRLPW